MTELVHLFEALQSASVAQTLAFAALFLPGFVALRTYEAKRGGESRKTNEVLLDVVGYSIIADVVGAALLDFSKNAPPAMATVLVSLYVVCTFVVVPIGLGLGWYSLQAHLVRIGFVVDPVEKPWDKVFERIVKEGLDLAAVVTLRDGRRVAGRLADPAYVSTFPAAEQVMLGELWRVDQNLGTFVERMRGSWGLLVDKADCETIEFVQWSEIESDLQEQATREGAADGAR